MEDQITSGASDEATIRLHEKGDKRRAIGLHLPAVPYFRPRLNPRSIKLADRFMDPASLYRLVESYLQQLPGAQSWEDGKTRRRRPYTAHSLCATTATLVLDAGVDITKVQHLLGHRHITTT